jgi:hypothetical protein
VAAGRYSEWVTRQWSGVLEMILHQVTGLELTDRKGCSGPPGRSAAASSLGGLQFTQPDHRLPRCLKSMFHLGQQRLGERLPDGGHNLRGA